MEMEADEEKSVTRSVEPPASTPKPRETEKIQCEHCDFTTIYPGNMKTHVERLHSGRRNGDFQCSFCAANFINQGSLTIHLRNSHASQGGVTVVSREPKDVQKKSLPIRNKDKPGGRKCNYCYRVFPNASQRRQHELAHTRPFTCHLCPRTFTRPFELQRHINIGKHGPMLNHSGQNQRVVTPSHNHIPSKPLLSDPLRRGSDVSTFSSAICKDHFSTQEDLVKQCGKESNDDSSSNDSGAMETSSNQLHDNR